MDKARGNKVKAIDERVGKADRVLGADVIVNHFREQQGLGSVVPCNMRHGSDCNGCGTEPEAAIRKISHQPLKLRTRR